MMAAMLKISREFSNTVDAAEGQVQALATDKIEKFVSSHVGHLH